MGRGGEHEGGWLATAGTLRASEERWRRGRAVLARLKGREVRHVSCLGRFIVGGRK